MDFRRDGKNNEDDDEDDDDGDDDDDDKNTIVSKKRIVIIGGGWAGLGAAKALCESGIKNTEIILMDAMSDPTGVRSVFSVYRFFSFIDKRIHTIVFLVSFSFYVDFQIHFSSQRQCYRNQENR